MTRTTTAPPPTDGTATGESREERIERLHKFLDTYSSTTLLVTVSDPFKTRRFLQTKRMFHVTTMDPTAKAGEEQWSVERSFDDFVLLRRTLQNRFPGILVSELPEDDTLDMFKSTSSKLTKQTETLTHWIMHLSRHPFASIDVVFLIFLSGASKFSDSIISLVDREDMSQLDPTSSSKMLSTLTAGRARRWFMNHFSRHHTTALEKLAQDETAHHGPYLYDNEAATTSAQWWWHEALEVAENPDDPDTLARNVVHEIERVKLSLKECNVVLLGLAASHKTTAGAYDVLAKTIGTWLGAEYSKDLLGTTDPEQNQVLQSEALHDTTHQEDESSSSSSSSSSGDRVQPYRGGLSRPTTLPIILAATTGDESQYISMPSALTRAVRRMKRQARTEKQLSENALITLIAAIRFELLYLDTLRDAVVDTEGRFDDEHTLSRMLRAREREVQDLEGQHRSNTMLSENFPEHRMDESRTSAVERRYYQAKSARDDLAAKVEAACHVSNLAKRATMSVELNYFRTERVLRITTFLQEFADVHAQFGETTSALWGGIGEVGTFPLSAMEQLQILQQQPLSRKTRSIYAVIPPKPAISAQIRRQQKRLLEAAAEPSPALDTTTTTTTITSKTTTKPQEGRSKKLQIVQDEEKRPLPEPSQEEEEEEEQRAPERQLLEGAPTEITKEGVTQERKGAVDDMTLAQARAIIAKYKYGGQEEAKEEEEEEERKPSVSRPMIIPKKYQGMYKKPITPGKRLNRDVQMDYDFEAENRDEISVRRGEILRGLRFADQDTAQWLIVENNQGRRGVVPVSLVSVFSSSDEEEEGEERRAPPRRARRISTQSTGTDVSSASTDQSEWQRAQQQQEEKWRRENEDLRNQLQEMRVEMQSIKSTTTTSPAEPEQQQQQPTTSNAKAIMSQPPAKSDRGAYTTPNAAAMNEAFQKGSTGAAPQLQQQPASGMQQRPQQRQQQPPSSLSGTRQTGPVIMTLNAPPPPQQREEQEPPPPPPTIQRERAQVKAEDEDNWVEPQQQQESATTAGEQEGEQGEQQQPPQKDKKRSGVLRWILGSGDKDKKQQQQQQQQQQQPITSEEHEEEEGKREDSTSGGEGRAVFLDKPPAESGTKAEYTTPSSAIELGPEQSQQQSESSGDADDPANWVQGFDPKYQRNFYFNTRTKESTWTKPSSWRSGGKTISSETTQQQQQQEQPMTAA